MQEATFDIWCGTFHQVGRCLETVAGLDNARRRMKEIARHAPGPYFIFSAWNGYVLDQIDTIENSWALNSRSID